MAKKMIRPIRTETEYDEALDAAQIAGDGRQGVHSDRKPAARIARPLIV